MKNRYAFIEYKRHEDAVAAISEFDRQNFEENQLTVQQSRK